MEKIITENYVSPCLSLVMVSAMMSTLWCRAQYILLSGRLNTDIYMHMPRNCRTCSQGIIKECSIWYLGEKL
jgi:hypothetical protein